MDHAHSLTPESLLGHQQFVLRLARTLVRDESDAEEVAQKTLASALERPPRHGALRAWLVRVTRNHAHELHRGDRRRADRERRAARSEAVSDGASAMERLELEHGVVRAVLALDEPYKAVVVATYYEGLAPAEIAARNGVPAGTVRSQLTRAHELLRAKLDRTHGERRTWMSGLTGLLALRDGPSGAVGAPASAPTVGSISTGVPSLVGPVSIGAGIAACIAVVFVVRAALAPPGAAIETAAVEPASVPVSTVESSLGASSPEPARAPIAQPAIAPAVVLGEFVPAEEPLKLLEQSRQIKKLILDRRLAVTAEERARAGIPTDTATTGVARLLDRRVFGEQFSLPWMRGGGSYYSFTEGVHDYNRRPQVALEESKLQASFYGASSAILVDLGERRLADVPASRVAPAGLAPAQGFLWAVAHAEVAPGQGGLRHSYAEMRNKATEEGELDEKLLATIEALARETVEVRPGHAYLLRSVSEGEHDVLVGVEVIAASSEQCTIAWRLLESRPVANAEPVRVPELQPADLPAPCPELARMSEAELRTALAAVRARSDDLLFERFSPEIEARFGAWRGQTDRGVVRLTPYLSEWAELSARQVGGAQYSFADRSHDAREHDISYQGQSGKGSLGCAFAGYDCGAFVDLGSTPIESIELASVASLGGELGTFVAGHVFPVPAELPLMEPARRNAIRAAMDVESESARRFEKRRDELGGSPSVRAVVGRTYAVRAVRFGAHDVLVAVHVAGMDDLGVVIGWKLLKSWPVRDRD